MNLYLFLRLQLCWNLPEDRVYFIMLDTLFPFLQSDEYSCIPLDEFGPEIYRQKRLGDPSILIVLERKYMMKEQWALVFTSDWSKSHKARPIWLYADSVDSLARVSRNEMILEGKREFGKGTRKR
jgi:hypothetical protein